MSYKLFTIKDNNIVINKPEVLTIPAFTNILRRDKGSPGDFDGRKKYKAFKEFAYIYHMADVKSVPNANGFNKAKANKYAIEKSGLDKDYKPDKVVREAIAIYKEAQDTLPRRTIMELTKTYSFLQNVFIKVRTNIEDILTTDKLTKDQTIEVLDLINVLIQQGEKLPTLTEKLTSAIGQLERADEKNNNTIMRGTDEPVPQSADPDRDL